MPLDCSIFQKVYLVPGAKSVHGKLCKYNGHFRLCYESAATCKRPFLRFCREIGNFLSLHWHSTLPISCKLRQVWTKPYKHLHNIWLSTCDVGKCKDLLICISGNERISDQTTVDGHLRCIMIMWANYLGIWSMNLLKFVLRTLTMILHWLL